MLLNTPTVSQFKCMRHVHYVYILFMWCTTQVKTEKSGMVTRDYTYMENTREQKQTFTEEPACKKT